MSSINTFNNQDIMLASAASSGAQTAVLASGVFSVYVWGTHAGTSTLQVSPDNGTTWIDYPGASFTANGTFSPVYLARDQKCRLNSGGSSINATLCPIA